MSADWIAPIAIAGTAVTLGWVVEWKVMPWVLTLAAKTNTWGIDFPFPMRTVITRST